MYSVNQILGYRAIYRYTVSTALIIMIIMIMMIIVIKIIIIIIIILCNMRAHR